MKHYKEDVVIVTRHKGAIEWLREHYPELCRGRVIRHAGYRDIKDKVVVGVLPVHMAHECREYWHLEMDLPQSCRGKELTKEDMEGQGCRLNRYVIIKANPEDWQKEGYHGNDYGND